MSIQILREFNETNQNFTLIQPNSTIKVIPETSEYSFDLGTIYVSESNFTFFDHNNKLGFSTTYPNIILHAIQRGGERPSVYIQLLDGFSQSNDDDDEEQINELLCYPGQDNNVDELYESICHCQTLHPDLEDDEEEEMMYTSEQNQHQLDLFEKALENGMGADFDPNSNQNGNDEEGEDDSERFEDA
ncbi:hypothetical protein CONCODRAFT_1883 [Conidiobolus coronatus NRRL 28638]|uniref:Methylosome subunit pICln n=1 Tax=Conidiobolus coronatus (strain ATCC 28846 / CBS 209.66 / NRRL 28638) TaxID=796925 RepID=A0A137PJD0_CONC2|nr:hypothetical protein CONCODRAFT_1883 [Conidiobolus coronatus NRRL 28638]|eukprot:KXN75089.1 hypothetical protein CONCODRAFT_1883 [Conidiobolus coronatus NRRL 28638]